MRAVRACVDIDVLLAYAQRDLSVHVCWSSSNSSPLVCLHSSSENVAIAVNVGIVALMKISCTLFEVVRCFVFVCRGGCARSWI